MRCKIDNNKITHYKINIIMGLDISKVSWELSYNYTTYSRLFNNSNIDIFQSNRDEYKNLKFDELSNYNSKITDQLLKEKKAVCALAYYDANREIIAGTIFHIDGHKFYILRLFVTSYIGLEFKEVLATFMEKLDLEYPGLRNVIVRICNKYHTDLIGKTLNNLDFGRVTSDSEINKLKFHSNRIMFKDCSEKTPEEEDPRNYTYYINENFDRYI